MSENAFVTEIAGVGHNAGVDPVEIVVDQIESALKQFEERRDALIKAGRDRAVTDNDSIGRAADVRSMILTLQEAIWARAKEVAAPHVRATSATKNRTEIFLAELAGIDSLLEQRIADCRAAQRQRAKLQREEQDRREAALRQDLGVVSPQIDSTAPAAPVSLPAVRGDYGTRVGDRALTTYVYEDVTKLPLDVLNSPGVAKAIQAALKNYAKLHTTIPGVTAEADLKTSTRRPN